MAHKNAPETAVQILDKYKREQKIIFGWKDFGVQLNFIKFVLGFPNFMGKSDLVSINFNILCTSESST